MKRLLVSIIVLSFTVSMLSAGLISFGFGAQAVNTKPIGDTTEVGSFEDWNFGAEMRLGVLFLEGTANGRFTPDGDFKGLVTAGTNFSLFGLLHMGLGAGPAIGLSHTDGAIAWMYTDTDGESSVAAGNLGEAFTEGLFHYRAHADVKFGRLSFGISYEVPSKGFTLANEQYLDLLPEWDDARFGTSVLFWLF